MKKEEKKRATPRKVFGVVGVVLCVLIAPILLINLIFIIESYVNPDEIPAILGLTPMVVVTDSMKPAISGGDMVVDRKVDPSEIRTGDVISFFDPTRSDRRIVITHRVVRIEENDGVRHFFTKGDANNTEDDVPVPEKNLVGVYQYTIPWIGGIVLFMRTTPGILLTVVLPILAVIAYELVRARKREKEKEMEVSRLQEEVAALAKQQNDPEATADCAI